MKSMSLVSVALTLYSGKEIDAGHLPLKVSVSFGAPLENVTRMAKNCGLNVCEKPCDEEGVHILELTKA